MRRFELGPDQESKGRPMSSLKFCPLTQSKQLLARLDFFANEENKLIICVDKIVDRIILEINTQDDCYFGINEISLSGLGEDDINASAYHLELGLENIKFKTEKRRQKYIDRFIRRVTEKNKIHPLKSSTKPDIQIVLNEPKFITKINLGAKPLHRLMGTHENLVVKTSYKGNISIAHSPKSDDNYLKTLNRAIQTFNIDTKKLEYSDSIFNTFEHALMEKIIAREIQSIDDLFLHQCLPLFASRPSLNSYQILALATILFKKNLSIGWRATKKYRFYKNLLWHDNIIQRVMTKYNQIHEAVYGKQDNFVLSKHSMQPSRLLTKKDDYLAAMQRMVEAGQNAGVEIIICYGTLLGAVRNQSFLPHDDDVDMLVMYKNVKSREEAVEQEDLLCSNLISQGISIKRKGKGIGFKARDTVNQATLDMFACWEPEEGQTMLMMEHFDYRTVPTNILRSPSQVHLYGKDFPAPSNPKAFLQERYGSTWEKPDPYHEFPWPVEMD